MKGSIITASAGLMMGLLITLTIVAFLTPSALVFAAEHQCEKKCCLGLSECYSEIPGCKCDCSCFSCNCYVPEP
jgi:hypothetical protein